MLNLIFRNWIQNDDGEIFFVCYVYFIDSKANCIGNMFLIAFVRYDLKKLETRLVVFLDVSKIDLVSYYWLSIV